MAGTTSAYSVDGGPIAVASDGTAFVTGAFWNGWATFGPNEPRETSLPPVGGTDHFITKFADDGSLIWAQSSRGHGWGGGIAVLPDDSGFYVSGGFSGETSFGPVGRPGEQVRTAAGQTDAFVARYENDEYGSLEWVETLGGVEGDAGAKCATTPDGGVVLTGSFHGEATFGAGDAQETGLMSTGDGMFVARYRSTIRDGTPDGEVCWARGTESVSADGRALGYSVGVGGNGMFVVGQFIGTIDFAPSAPLTSVSSCMAGNPSADGFVATYRQ